MSEDAMRQQTQAYVDAVYAAHPDLIPPHERQEPRTEPEGPTELVMTQEQIDALLTVLKAEQKPRWKGIARTIIKGVAQKHDLKVQEIIGPRRDKRYVEARQEAMYLVREHTALSWTQIAAIFGDRDHTTCMYGARRHKARMQDEVYRKPRNKTYPWPGQEGRAS